MVKYFFVQEIVVYALARQRPCLPPGGRWISIAHTWAMERRKRNGGRRDTGIGLNSAIMVKLPPAFLFSQRLVPRSLTASPRGKPWRRYAALSSQRGDTFTKINYNLPCYS